MNEVYSTEVETEIETLTEVNASGLTGFQEKFKVSKLLYDIICYNVTMSVTMGAAIYRGDFIILSLVKIV